VRDAVLPIVQQARRLMRLMLSTLAPLSLLRSFRNGRLGALRLAPCPQALFLKFSLKT